MLSLLRERASPVRAVFRWFLLAFLVFSLIFLIALFPLMLYTQNVFSELELKKSTQKMESGIEILDSTFSTIANASVSIYNDSRFRQLHYPSNNYNDVSAVSRNQMRDYLGSLVLPNSLIRDSALQLSENDAVTPQLTTFGVWTGYYPFYFQVDDLTYEQWRDVLDENDTGYLPVYHITTPTSSYDALIYSIQWSKDRYFYSCLDLTKIREAMISSDSLEDFKLTITNSSNTCLYSDLEENMANEYHSVSRKTSSGGLTVTVHVPNSVMSERMTPLYHFLTVYLVIWLVVLIICILFGTHLSSRPLVQIIDSLKKRPKVTASPPGDQQKSITYGFHFISDHIQSYQKELLQYQNAIETQEKVLQARFMEKAFHGSLSTDEDYATFYSYFPGFPDSYRLLLFGIAEDTDNIGQLYPNVMAIIQCYLQASTPMAYVQQLTVDTLLMVISEKDYQEYYDAVNRLIENINREEPCYHAWGIISKNYRDLKDIPFAYLQIQDLRSKLSTDSLYGLCAVSDIKMPRKTRFQMSDATAIYSALTNGNQELSLHYLQNYAEQLGNRSVYEMFYSILLCVKHEYADLLMDVKIPIYRSQADLYPLLAECITTFCQLLQSEKLATVDSFAQQVKTYIDQHYHEESLCSTSLEDHFKCSFVKIRKNFSKEFGTSISAYIESKRMSLANELLLKGENSVTEVYQMCGYTNYNTFLKAYQRTYGTTPSSTKQKK